MESLKGKKVHVFPNDTRVKIGTVVDVSPMGFLIKLEEVGDYQHLSVGDTVFYHAQTVLKVLN